MREGIGGSMLMYIIIPVVIMFIFFVAFVINYASAYRAANYVVTQIETCQGQMGNCNHADFESIKNVVKTRYHYLDRINYSCRDNTRGSVWTVTLYVSMEIPIVGLVGVYKVSAETKTMYGTECPT